MPQIIPNSQDQNLDVGNILKQLLTIKSDPNDPMQNWKGTANMKPQLDPYQEGVKKALKQAGEEHAFEAIQNGVPTEHIITQSGLKPQSQDPTQILASLLQSPQQQQPQQMNQQTQQPGLPESVQPASTPVGKFLESAGFGVDTKSKLLDNMLKAQELQGQKPLQAGEKERLNIEQQGKFFENVYSASQKQQTPEEAKLLGNINSGITQIDALSAAVEKDPNIFKKWTMPGDTTRDSITTMVDDVKDVLGRLRSGGAIGAEEEKSFLKQLPEVGGVFNIQNPKTAKFKLNKLRNLLSDIRQIATPRSSDFAQKVMKLRQLGATDDQIYKAYKGMK